MIEKFKNELKLENVQINIKEKYLLLLSLILVHNHTIMQLHLLQYLEHFILMKKHSEIILLKYTYEKNKSNINQNALAVKIKERKKWK
jgi:hypothetical protein